MAVWGSTTRENTVMLYQIDFLFSPLFSSQSDSVKYKLQAKESEQEGEGIKFINTHLANIYQVYDVQREERGKAEKAEGWS